jgi:hypothetical protein
MAKQNKNRKTQFYLPVTLGALVFAAFGVASAINAAGSDNNQAASSEATVNEQSRQPDGGICSPALCATCGFCSTGQFNIQVESSPLEFGGPSNTAQ